MKIGEIMASDREITLNEGKKTVTVMVANKGDRPVQVGSHFHFFEVNRALEFDRHAAYGMRMNISSTTAIRFEPGDEKTVSLVSIGGTSGTYGFNNLVDRFEPGEEKEVQLVEMGGRKRVFGLNDLTRAQATADTKAASLENAKLKGFL